MRTADAGSSGSRIRRRYGRYRSVTGRGRRRGAKVFDLLVHLIAIATGADARGAVPIVWDGREVSDATLSNHVRARARRSATAASCSRRFRPSRPCYQFVHRSSRSWRTPRPVIETTPAPATRAPRRRRDRQSGRVASAPVRLVLRWSGRPADGILLVGARFLLAPSAPPELDALPLVVPFGVSDNATEYTDVADQ